MKFLKSKLFGLLTMGALVACGSDDSNASSSTEYVPSKNGVFLAKVEWPEPLKAGPGVNNQAIVTIVKADGQTPGEVTFSEFHPRMPAHGHGTNETDQQIAPRTDATNVFDVTGIMFVMAGEATTWVTDVVATVDGQTDQAEVPISRDVE